MLHGKRLLGAWVLVRTRRERGRAQWLLIKHRDEYATTKLDVTKVVETSVTTGRTMDEITLSARPVTQAKLDRDTVDHYAGLGVELLIADTSFEHDNLDALLDELSELGEDLIALA